MNYAGGLVRVADERVILGARLYERASPLVNAGSLVCRVRMSWPGPREARRRAAIASGCRARERHAAGVVAAPAPERPRERARVVIVQRRSDLANLQPGILEHLPGNFEATFFQELMKRRARCRSGAGSSCACASRRAPPPVLPGPDASGRPYAGTRRTCSGNSVRCAASTLRLQQAQDIGIRIDDPTPQRVGGEDQRVLLGVEAQRIRGTSVDTARRRWACGGRTAPRSAANPPDTTHARYSVPGPGMRRQDWSTASTRGR